MGRPKKIVNNGGVLLKTDELQDTANKLQNIVDKSEFDNTTKLPMPIEESNELLKGFVPTGSTLLNLALTDDPYVGYKLGRIINLIGDSAAGKSILALTMFAEICQYEEFDNYSLILDDAEAALSFNIENLFGEKVANRIDTETYQSDTIQDFYGTLQKLLEKENPFIYVLDSLDSLQSEEDIEKDKRFQKKPEDRTKAEKSGDFGLYLPKLAKRTFKGICRGIEKTESLLIIISQTIDNVGYGFNPKTRAGGKALKFFSSGELWLSVTSPIKQTVNKNERIVGITGKCRIGKNKMTGKLRECPVIIYYDYGIDDIGANVKFLIDSDTFKKNGKSGYDAPELGLFNLSEDKLIREVELNGKERKLQALVGKTWNDIEESHRLNRKRRF